MCSYGVLSTIVKIAILKIILVTDNLVYSEAVFKAQDVPLWFLLGTRLKFGALQFGC